MFSYCRLEAQVGFSYERHFQFGGDRTEWATDICLDQSDNILLFGFTFSDSLDVDPGSSHSYHIKSPTKKQDQFIVKYDPVGNLLWSKKLESEAWTGDIQCDKNNNVTVTGMIDSIMDVNPGSTPSLIGQSSNKNQGYIAMFDSSGNLIWANAFDNLSNSQIASNSVTCHNIDSKGNIIILGSASDSINLGMGATQHVVVSGGGHYMAKFDPAGNVLWSREFGSPSYIALSDFKVNSKDEVIIVGIFADSLLMGSSVIDTSKVHQNPLIVVKLDSTGNYITHRSFETRGSSFSIALDTADNIYTYGNVESHFDRDPGLGVDSAFVTGIDQALIKLDRNLSWTRTYVFESTSGFIGNNATFDIEVDDEFNIYLLCDPGLNGMDLQPNLDTSNFHLSKQVDGGSYLLIKFDSSINQSYYMHADYGDQLALDSDYEIVMIGQLLDSTDLDPGPGQIMTSPSQGAEDVWVLKLNNCDPSLRPAVSRLPHLYAQCSIDSLVIPEAISGCGFSLSPNDTVQLPISVQGKDTLQWKFDDGKSYKLVQNQNIEIRDSIAPRPLVLLDSFITSRCEVNLTTPVAYDSCAGNIRASTTSSFPLNSSDTVIWVFDDGNGNISTQKQIVVIYPFDTTISRKGPTLISNDTIGTYTWFDCNTFPNVINGATQKSFTPAQNGSYALQLADTLNFCHLNTRCYTVNNVGIEEKLSDIKLYPNPNQGQFVIWVSEETVIRVLDIHGKIVYEEKLQAGQKSIDLGSKISQGAYILESTSTQGRISRQRLVVTN